MKKINKSASVFNLKTGEFLVINMKRLRIWKRKDDIYAIMSRGYQDVVSFIAYGPDVRCIPTPKENIYRVYSDFRAIFIQTTVDKHVTPDPLNLVHPDDLPEHGLYRQVNHIVVSDTRAKAALTLEDTIRQIKLHEEALSKSIIKRLITHFAGQSMLKSAIEEYEQWAKYDSLIIQKNKEKN